MQGLLHLRVELNGVDAPCFIRHGGDGAGGTFSKNVEARGQGYDLVAV